MGQKSQLKLAYFTLGSGSVNGLCQFFTALDKSTNFNEKVNDQKTCLHVFMGVYNYKILLCYTLKHSALKL